MAKVAGRFDLILDTVPYVHDVNPYVPTLVTGARTSAIAVRHARAGAAQLEASKSVSTLALDLEEFGGP
jgi:D-arabinose 1-dehydrogenase-like Zn-dependent alcohol dehydrogenase